jgi:hypothetical protein
MPTPQARALSIQEQQALELIAGSVSAQATALYLESKRSKKSEAALMAGYSLLIAGAVKATAQTRVAYLQGFAAANGKPAFNVPRIALNPRVDDFLVDGVRPEGAVRHVQALNRKWESELDRQRQSLLKRMNEVDDEFSPLSDAEVRRRAAAMAGNKLGTLAESTVTSAADFVTRSVLDPDRRVAALRRVIHPGACDRCQRVASVLVFKVKPRLRHDQCRCSFEPVYTDDPDYLDRLMRYRTNAAATSGSRYLNRDGSFSDMRMSSRAARETRYRGRQQLAAADARESSLGLRKAWDEFLQDEENRANNLVRAIKSNTFRDWDVMVDVTESLAGGAGFTAITRR